MTGVDAPEADALAELVRVARARQALGAEAEGAAWVLRPGAGGAPHYANRNDRLEIDFAVERLAFPALQTMDPRVVRIAPGKRNEHHRHAHESLFVVLSGEGEVCLGERWLPVVAGDVAFVPRWIFHQTRNTSPSLPLELLAVTDFGFTSAVLGDYDHRTRLAGAGEDASPREAFTPAPGAPLDLGEAEGPALVHALAGARRALAPGDAREVHLADPGAGALLAALVAAGWTALPRPLPAPSPGRLALLLRA